MTDIAEGLPDLDPDDVRAAAKFLGDKDLHPGWSSTLFKTIKGRRIAKGKRSLYIPKVRQPTQTVRQTEQSHLHATKRADAFISRMAQVFRPRKIP